MEETRCKGKYREEPINTTNMSLSNKLTLDQVDVNGKRVVMRYVSCVPPRQLIGCEIICRLLPNCRVGRDCTEQRCMFPKTLSRRCQTHGQRCVNRPRSSARLQEVNLSRLRPCYVPVRRCCMDADWCYPQTFEQTVMFILLYAAFRQFATKFWRRRYFVIYSTAKPQIQHVVSNLTC